MMKCEFLLEQSVLWKQQPKIATNTTPETKIKLQWAGRGCDYQISVNGNINEVVDDFSSKEENGAQKLKCTH